MRRPQPALCDRRMRIDRALEHNFLEIASEHAQDGEDIRIRRARRNEKLECRRTVDLGIVRNRRREERHAIAHRIEAFHGLAGRALLAQRSILRIEIELRPLRALEWPFVLRSRDELVDVPHLQKYRWPFVPAVLLAMQEI